MTYLVAVGVTVGILAGAWCFAADTVGLISFTGFLGWATYFAAGGGVDKGVRLGLCANLSGVVWGVLTTIICMTFPEVPYYFFVIIFAGIMCWQAHVELLSFIPGTFVGNAAYYAAGAVGYGSDVNYLTGAVFTACGLACGIFLGILSDKSAKLLTRSEQS